MTRLRNKGTVALAAAHDIADLLGDDNEWLDGWIDETGLDYRTIAETPYRLTKVQSVAESGEARGAVYEVTIPTTGVTIGVIYSEYVRGWSQEASWRYGSRSGGDTWCRRWGYGADIEDARSPYNHNSYSQSWEFALTRLIEEYADAQGLPTDAGRFYTTEQLTEQQVTRWWHWDSRDSRTWDDPDAGRPRVERPVWLISEASSQRAEAWAGALSEWTEATAEEVAA